MNKYILLFTGLLISSVMLSQNKATELYFSAERNFSEKNYNEAIANYTELLDLVDNDQVVVIKRCYYMRGFSWDKLGKYDNAISDFTFAIKTDSTDMASFVDRGITRQRAGYNDEAKSDFKHVIKMKSDSRMVNNSYYWLARIHFTEGNFETCKTYCNFFIRENAKEPEIYFIKGSANDMLLNYQESIEDYTLAIKYNTNYYQAFANRGTAKINLLTTKGKVQPSKRETKSACKDLKKAKNLGDNSVDDLIFIYCK